MVLGVSVVVTILAAASAGAETWDPDASNVADPAPVATTSDDPADPGPATRPGLDPFRALVQPPEEPPVIPVHTPVPVPTVRPPPPPVPVAFKVEAIAGDPGQYMAVLEYGGQTYIVSPGMRLPESGPTQLEVKDVSSERVVVYDFSVKRLVERGL